MERYCAWCDCSLDSHFDRLMRLVFNRFALLFGKIINIKKTHGICDRCFFENFPYLFSLASAKKNYRYNFYPNIEILVTRRISKKCYLDMENYKKTMEAIDFECKPCSRRRLLRNRGANLNELKHSQATDLQFSFGLRHLMNATRLSRKGRGPKFAQLL